MARQPILDRLTEQGLGLLVEREGRLQFASDREGLTPLADAAFRTPDLLDGADTALPAVGLAAAYLLIYAKVGRVFAGALSQEARQALDEEGIEHSAAQTVKKLPVQHGERSAELDARARESVTPQAFVEELRRLGE